jgi:hypothetical protein
MTGMNAVVRCIAATGTPVRTAALAVEERETQSYTHTILSLFLREVATRRAT